MDGKYFGRSSCDILFPEFPGTTKITSLHTYPLELHSEKQKLKDKLVERGRKLEELAGYHFKSYDGLATTWANGKEVQSNVSGHIVIDHASFNSYGPATIRVRPWATEDFKTLGEYQRLSDYQDDGFSLDKPKNMKLTTPYYLIYTCRVYSYYLKEKKWMAFYLHKVEDIKWNTSAFNKVMLPPSDKELVSNLAESQNNTSAAKFDDFIHGKGKGIVILLSGPPGVGKTVTAEAMAEGMKAPLLTIGFTDLGVSMHQIEWNLREILAVAAKWKTVLLLDECEFFLQSRSRVKNIADSVSVSVFLRLLEYYEGIIFLTTNYPDRIDEAIMSHIHLHLEYPDLDSESRRQIWVNLLELLANWHELSEDDLSVLTEHKLNGRQIKNALKVAQLIAGNQKYKMTKHSIDTILAKQGRLTCGIREAENTNPAQVKVETSEAQGVKRKPNLDEVDIDAVKQPRCSAG